MDRIETNDVFKGAYLLSRSCRLKETRFVDAHQVRFVIEGKDIFDEDRLYHNGQATVEPLRLKECLSFLRKRLNETLNTYKPRKPHATNTGRGF